MKLLSWKPGDQELCLGNEVVGKEGKSRWGGKKEGSVDVNKEVWWGEQTGRYAHVATGHGPLEALPSR